MQKLEEAGIEDIKQSQFTAADRDTTAIQKVLIYCVSCVNLWLSVQVEQKTKLQILEEQIQKESELKYYTEEEYKVYFINLYSEGYNVVIIICIAWIC